MATLSQIKANQAKQKSTKDSFDGGRSRAAKVIARFNSMESEALNFRTRWQECANYIQPRKGNILTMLSPGQPQTMLLWDTTAEQALVVYAAGLVSFLTPPTELWARYEPKNKNASPALKDWFSDCTERVMAEIANSNFYEVWHEDCLDGGGFGSSLMRADEYADDQEDLLGFANIPVGTFYWNEDNRGRIATIGRKWKWTAMQACEEFGEDSLTPQLLKCYQSKEVGDHTRQFNFIEMVTKRRKEDVRPGTTLPENRPWEALYVCTEDNEIVREDGYYENPYAGCRVMRSNNEVYGRGPGTQAMPEIKMVNRMREDFCVILERMGRPSWISPDDTAYDPDNRPDGVTYWDASKGKDYKPEQVQLRNQVPDIKEMIEDSRSVIRDYFFNDMFKLLTREDVMEKEKTAYEVSQMVAERMILFSPIFGRITKEKLNPILYRVFSIMYRNKRFKPLPLGIRPEDIDFEVNYISKIALALKAVKNQAFATAVQLIESVMTLDPSLRYLLKCEDGARDVLGNVGVPAKWMRSKAEIQQLWAKDQAEQQQVQASQAALQGTQAIKNLGPVAQAAGSKAVAAAAPKPGQGA